MGHRKHGSISDFYFIHYEQMFKAVHFNSAGKVIRKTQNTARTAQQNVNAPICGAWNFHERITDTLYTIYNSRTAEYNLNLISI